jgi:hypothetical protein
VIFFYETFPCDPVQMICILHVTNVSMNVVVSLDHTDTRLDDVKIGNIFQAILGLIKLTVL